MSDSPARWKANGLPRKGWKLIDVTDTDSLDEQCEWCGTFIRYIHHLVHSSEKLKTTCGCICAEHLTEDYINPKKMENELKLYLKRMKTKYKSFMKGFRTSQKGNLYNKKLKELVVIIIKDEGYYLKIGEIYGKKLYDNVDAASKSAFKYLMKKYKRSM